MRTSANPKPMRINARFTGDDYDRLVRFARAAGCSITDALRVAVRNLPTKVDGDPPPVLQASAPSSAIDP